MVIVGMSFIIDLLNQDRPGDIQPQQKPHGTYLSELDLTHQLSVKCLSHKRIGNGFQNIILT